MEDPYKVLGVAPAASQDDIRKAYRNLAKQHHPDLHPGDVESEAKFKLISSANALLSDPEKRARYDAEEIDAEGNERPPNSFYRAHADTDDGARYARYDGKGDPEAMSDIFGDLFRRGHTRNGFKMRGHDLRYSIDIPFLEAARGSTRTATMADGKTLNITIPEGMQNGQTLRLRGEGMPGIDGGPSGDAYIDVHVIEHPFYEQKGNDVHVTVPITLPEAVLGGKIKVPTIDGIVEMSVPQGSNTGTILRLKNRGISSKKNKIHGHQYVRLDITLPDEPDPELVAFIESWAKINPYDPRADILGTAL